MKYHSLSYYADFALKRFNESVLKETDEARSLCLKKISLCACDVLLVTPDNPDLSRQVFKTNSPKEKRILFDAWKSVLDNPLNIHNQKKAWQSIDQIGKPLVINKKFKRSTILRHFNDDHEFNKFFLLLSGREPGGIPIAEVYPLCNIWQMAHSHFPLHAAGVICNDRLLVFLGQSGAGKSTISEQCKIVGYTSLDEDQLLISPLTANQYKADAWGYNLNKCNIPVSAFFSLVQDTTDQIIPLKHIDLARLLFERHNDVSVNHSTDELSRKAFAFFSGAARRIPGYKLHFRKSPDFWKLIDERFLQ